MTWRLAVSLLSLCAALGNLACTLIRIRRQQELERDMVRLRRSQIQIATKQIELQETLIRTSRIEAAQGER